ncbi:UDP-glucose/GDP-mannose dehydrogenase family protein [Candidatus Kapabacteria bacterium]|nr:UDP-glucose/GDP-mannose dehydrogenase family protein [Candidatus Kapabacteria bacterium]
MSFNIGVVGTGYVGIVSGTTFAETGNNVICIDIDEQKVEKMREGISPIFEPGLERLLKQNIDEGRLTFSTKLEEAVLSSSIIFLCLPTPPGEGGAADLQYVMKVTEDISEIIKKHNIKERRILVNKSTVPVGTAQKTRAIINNILGDNHDIHVCSNPEFLREGFAVEDALKPERVVVGTDNSEVAETLKSLYKPFLRQGNPIFVMDVKSSELTKYAANSFLAAKISFMNDLSYFCEKVGADIDLVRLGIGSDSRIGKRFLFAGLGYGGSCFPKDVQALNYASKDIDADLKIVQATEDVNKRQGERFFNKILNRFKGNIKGKKFAIWGLAFKPNTDDVREAPAFNIIQNMLDHGAEVAAYDQEAIENTKLTFGNKIEYTEDMYTSLDNSDALVICTEWNVFRNPDFDKMKSKLKNNIIFDGRNVFDLVDIKDTNIEYHSLGRKSLNVSI